MKRIKRENATSRLSLVPFSRLLVCPLSLPKHPRGERKETRQQQRGEEKKSNSKRKKKRTAAASKEQAKKKKTLSPPPSTTSTNQPIPLTCSGSHPSSDRSAYARTAGTPPAGPPSIASACSSGAGAHSASASVGDVERNGSKEEGKDDDEEEKPPSSSSPAPSPPPQPQAEELLFFSFLPPQLFETEFARIAAPRGTPCSSGSDACLTTSSSSASSTAPLSGSLSGSDRASFGDTAQAAPTSPRHLWSEKRA